MTNSCTCKAEHWQNHVESCPAYKPRPLLTVENIRSGAIPADAFVAGFLLGEIERLRKREGQLMEFLRSFISGGVNQDFKPWARELYQKLYGTHEPLPCASLPTSNPDCPKCHGAGWVYGTQLENPSFDTQMDTMTHYTCDSAECNPEQSQGASRDASSVEAHDHYQPQIDAQMAENNALRALLLPVGKHIWDMSLKLPPEIAAPLAQWYEDQLPPAQRT